MAAEIIHLKDRFTYHINDVRVSGKYVSYDDYETLLKENERLRKRFKEFDDEWPGGLSEIEAAMHWRDKMISELEKRLE